MPYMGWETPKDFFNTLDNEFQFTLDVCATKETAKCAQYYTVEQNGLLLPWNGKCWVNPPYDRSLGKWLQRAYEASQNGSTVVVLLQGRSSDTKWWHNYVMKATEIRYIKNRLSFGREGKFQRANISNVVVVFTPYCQGPPSTCSIDTLGRKLA